MKVCKECGSTSIVTVTEVDRKGNKKKIHFCNDCGKESLNIEDIAEWVEE